MSLFETAAVTTGAMAASVTVALLHLRLAQGRLRHRLFMLAVMPHPAYVSIEEGVSR